MISINAGTFVKTRDGMGRVLHLAEYEKVGANGEKTTEPTAAMVIFPSKWAGLYPFTDLVVISEDEYKKVTGNGNGHEPTEAAALVKPEENVWRWCPVCWVCTDHRPRPYLMLQCTICGNRIPRSVPDMAQAYAVPAEDEKPLAVVTERDR